MKILFTLITTIFLIAISTFPAGGGHGTYLPAKLIFPYTMLLAGIEGYIGVIGQILALIQVPIYALIIDKKPNWNYYLIVSHVVAVLIAVNFNSF